jgi:hypothetical protein
MAAAYPGRARRTRHPPRASCYRILRPMDKATILEVTRMLGKIGGKTAAKNMSKAERAERARNASAARWKKAKPKKQGGKK